MSQHVAGGDAQRPHADRAEAGGLAHAGAAPPGARVAIFVPAMHDGGAERTMLNLSQVLAARGYPVDLVLARAEGPHLGAVPASVRLIDLRARRVLASLPALAGYLRRWQPGALLSVMNHANIVALWARRLAAAPTRVFVSERNTLSLSARNGTSWRARMMPRLIARYYPWADGIVTVSHGVADDLARVMQVPRERIDVIYNPVVTPELRRKAQAPLDHPWFAPGEPPVVLAVGRLRAQKDFPTLIRAFAQASARHPARLLILGEGPERSALEQLVRELGVEQVVSMPGFIENPYPYMARAALFVLSSRWEGLPGVLIEALYCGAPVIATDCPSGPREILAGGRFGRLVPVGGVPALAQAIEAGLAGSLPKPPRASWLPFEGDLVVEQYIKLLVGARPCES